jgi:hypothetical protein
MPCRGVYGFVIVTNLTAEADDGIDADNLASELVTWRDRVFPRRLRRQAEPESS